MPSIGPNNPSIFGIHADALRLHRERMELIASNLANADTPNFKAKDLDFQSVLAQSAATPGGLDATNAAHIGTTAGSAAAPGVLLRTPTQNTLDGNTVDAQREQAAFADSAIHYQASLMFAESRIRGLLAAITGE
jgi:flagellar basal-body rod protein FlgB